MTNPTLAAQGTPWRGFTWTQLLERLLAGRGLTLDSSTGRTLATTSDQTDAEYALHQAFQFLVLDFPGLFNDEEYEVAWIEDDHSIALPANVMAITNISYGGRDIPGLDRDGYYRLRRDDDAGGDIGPRDEYPDFYRVVGRSDEDAGATEGDVDWRIVVRLHPRPIGSKTLRVRYLAFVDDTSGDSVDGNTIALFPFAQSWVLQRAREIWAAETGDSASQKVAESERMKTEKSIENKLEGQRPKQSVARWQYPNVRKRGGRY